MAFSHPEGYPGFDPFAGFYIGLVIVSLIVVGFLWWRRFFTASLLVLGVNIGTYLLLFVYYFNKVVAAFVSDPNAQRVLFQDQPTFFVAARMLPLGATLLFSFVVILFVSGLVFRKRSMGCLT